MTHSLSSNSGTERHDVTIDLHAKSSCKTLGHFDTLVECSCGWSKRLDHGSGDNGIVGHRLEVLERVAGIATTVKGKARGC